jgi:hypothetical protein
MSGFVDFLEEYLHERLADIDIGMIGKIETFDSKKMRADVIPLLKKKSSDQEIEYSIIKDVPVCFLFSGGFYIRPAYQQGDLVYITFSTHDIEQALKEEISLASERIFCSDNALIVGSVAKTDWEPPDEFSEDGLLIGHKNGKVFTHYKEDEIIHKVGQTTFKMTDSEVNINDGALIVEK